MLHFKKIFVQTKNVIVISYLYKVYITV